MADKTLHFQGDLHLQEQNGEWYIENRETGDVSGPVNIGELKSESVDAGELSTNLIEGVADHIITDKTALQNLPENLSNGDTVAVGDVTHDSIIDIDGVDDITIFGTGRYSSSITTEDNAEVGLFRFGTNSAVGAVEIHDITLDGNNSGQNGDVTEASAIHAEDVSELTIRNVRFVDTLETRLNSTSNSSCVRALHPAGVVKIENCHFYSNVTRQVETSCEKLVVDGMTSVNGHERCISLSSLKDNGRITQKAHLRNLDMRVGEGSNIGSFIATHGSDCTSVGETSVSVSGEGHQEIVISGDITLIGAKRGGIALRDFGDADCTPKISGDVTIKGVSQQGIIFARSSTPDNTKIISHGIEIDNVAIESESVPISVQNCTDPVVENFEVTPSGANTPIGVDLKHTSGAVVKPSHIKGCGVGILSQDTSTQTAVEGGKIESSQKQAIRLESDNSEAKNVLVIGPAMDTSSTYDGIMASANNCAVQSCTIRDTNANTRDGVMFSGVTGGAGTNNVGNDAVRNVANSFNSTGVTFQNNVRL